jgi:divalent metal cation (Fe/Co/Zn/Cd) transporter
MQLGPNEVLLNLEVEFRSDLSAGELVAAIHRIEKTIRAVHPEVTRLFLEAGALRSSGLDRLDSPERTEL